MGKKKLSLKRKPVSSRSHSNTDPMQPFKGVSLPLPSLPKSPLKNLPKQILSRTNRLLLPRMVLEKEFLLPERPS